MGRRHQGEQPSGVNVGGGSSACRDLFGIPEMMDAGIRNVLWVLFTVPGKDCPIPSTVHQEPPLMVATLRGGYGRHTGEPARETFVADPSAVSPYFAQPWCKGDVAPPGPRVNTFRRYMASAEIRMTSVSLSVNGLSECRIVACTPADRESERQMTMRCGRRQKDPAP
ncbi:hypothetical protein OG244_27270 [Streptomyces brevispora]